MTKRRVSRQRYWAIAASVSLIGGGLLIGYAMGRYLPDVVVGWMRR